MNSSDSETHPNTDISSGVVLLELPLQPAATKMWKNTSSVVLGLALTAAMAVLSLIVGYWGLLVLLPGALVIALVRYYWGRYPDHFACRMLEDGLLVRRGVWWRAEIFVPRSRIQHTEVNQGPLARHYEIAQISVYTAGSHASKIEVDGLAHGQALELRDQLLGRDGYDAV